jgi:integrase/recombinase XerC
MPRPAKPWYRVQKNSWYITLKGRIVSLGVQGKQNRKKAVAEWHRLVVEGKAQEPAKPVTVAELGEEFLSDARTWLKPNTLIWYERSVGELSTSFGREAVASLTVVSVERWLQAHGWSATTRNHVIGVLHVCFRWAIRRKLIDSNPLSGIIKPLKHSRGDEAVITPDDHKRLLNAATEQFRNVLHVLHATGARPSEVCSITAENFDPTTGLVKLLDHKTARHGKPRVIYLTPDAVRLLAGLRENTVSGPILRNRRGRAWTKDAVVLAMRRLRDRTGVKATAYSYRHTFATEALVSGVPETHVAELLGHSSTAMLHQHYAHLGSKAQAMHAALNRVR